MKRLIFWLLILFLVGCSQTKIIDLSKEEVPEPKIEQVNVPEKEEEVNQKTTQEEISEEKEDTSHLKSGSKIIDPNKSEITETNEQFNAAEEYKVISCCEEGILTAETKKTKESYSIGQVKDILLAIQDAHCDEFSSYPAYRINMKYNSEVQEENYLKYFRTSDLKEIKVNRVTISEEFNSCN